MQKTKTQNKSKKTKHPICCRLGSCLWLEMEDHQLNMAESSACVIAATQTFTILPPADIRLCTDGSMSANGNGGAGHLRTGNWTCDPCQSSRPKSSGAQGWRYCMSGWTTSSAHFTGIKRNKERSEKVKRSCVQTIIDIVPQTVAAMWHEDIRSK